MMVALLLEARDLLVDHQVRRLADLLAPAQRAVGLTLQVVVALAQQLALPLAARLVAKRLGRVTPLDRGELLFKKRLLAAALGYTMGC